MPDCKVRTPTATDRASLSMAVLLAGGQTRPRCYSVESSDVSDPRFLVPKSAKFGYAETQNPDEVWITCQKRGPLVVGERRQTLLRHGTVETVATGVSWLVGGRGGWRGILLLERFFDDELRGGVQHQYIRRDRCCFILLTPHVGGPTFYAQTL
ncbi:hypothetical protein SODALDRAFT_59164 [Sodiomyces alkalinus F11]|uniref:Uncharacterized protein n=1 Tax=Sodiomyces alkalinus (strain CBS 110278 / VKM F-3762 / F11) TaxID=1314773 RepID=A0A3N2PNU3_SODAK|nr:hypothetical protein SODALDRAFT_59164 [Sodiomyces alkalinus F11]ROT36172.1 hypothetical protein SODALDRAFT_59164 [Sodiomyces alkalinus F11]